MFLSGIADEAGRDIATQIRAHQELDWKHIELRTIGGTCITDVADVTFDGIAQRLSEAGISVSCFASQLANWARPINTDVDIDLAELRRAIPRMQQMGTRFIRCMSYPNSNPPLGEEEWRKQVIERMQTLTDLAASADVVLVHENCHGWASQSAEQTIELLDQVDSPHLKLVFDTGNPICSGQDVWELYRALRDHIVYVHIKDYRRHADGDSENGVTACFPGEGLGYVAEITRDLIESRYTGGFSIEPHIESVIHLDKQASDPQVAYETYIQYGQRFAEILQAVH